MRYNLGEITDKYVIDLRADLKKTRSINDFLYTDSVVGFQEKQVFPDKETELKHFGKQMNWSDEETKEFLQYLKEEKLRK